MKRQITTSHSTSIISLVLSIICIFSTVAGAGNWPMYRADPARSGLSAETIGPKLFLHWTYTPAHPPKPAWPMPAEELPRMHNDNAYHVVVADGCAYFGSSNTDKVTSIDVRDGRIRWEFYTEGPVRFAPAVDDGKVFVGSDDGYVYCLDSEDGSLVWRHRAGPSGEKVIGNGRMISLWPVRTGVLVGKGVVYFAAGIFPYEGLYICALKACDGSVVWKNDTIGDRAHELEYGGISPHGYMLASENIVYVPSGRSMPAAFDRHTGKFLYYASPGAKRGGAWALLDENRLISGVDYSGRPYKVAYDAQTGKRQGDAFAWYPGIDMTVTRDFSYIVTEQGIYAIDRAAHVEAVKKVSQLSENRKTWRSELDVLKKKAGSDDETEQMAELTKKINNANTEEKRLKGSSFQWRYPGMGLRSIVLTGDVVFTGGEGIVKGIDNKTGNEVWTHEIDGTAVALAVSDGCLLVSSNKGPIYCFSRNEIDKPKEISPKIVKNPFPNDSLTETYKSAAEKILAESKIRKGYALVLDCGQGRLAYELAKRTRLKIVGLEKDPQKLAIARKNLEAAGLWGKRVVVEPWDMKSLPDYFANLIVSDGMLLTGETMGTVDEGRRVLRPWGGTASLSFHRDGEINWRTYVRGPLEDAGAWTHQYCDPENTACSSDELVYGPLGMLWFGEPGPMGMVERHGRAQSPVSMNGRLFMQGEEIVMAADAFNGTPLWERKIPGAVRVKIKADCGNLALTEDSLYIAARDKCYRLDVETGRTIREYKLPASRDGMPRRWGYISVVDNILYGSTAKMMNEEYGAMLKRFVENGKYKRVEDVPEEHRERFQQVKKQYPDPHGLEMAAQRAGYMYRSMTSFGPGGEFLQTNAVTDDLMVSDMIFALDTETGEILWKRNGKKIANVTISLGDGKLFFADCKITDKQKRRALRRRQRLTQQGIYKEREGILEELREMQKYHEDQLKKNKSYQGKSHVQYFIDSLRAELFEEEHPEGTLTFEDADVRVAFALDARSGDPIWRCPVDLTGCCGDRMGSAYADGLLLFFGNHGNHDAWRFREGGMKWRRITALSAKDGNMVWSRALNYRTRPVIVGDKIILEPRACELHTGKTIMREHPITGEQVPWEFLRPGHTCGLTAASAKGLFYRSACTAFYDLKEDNGVTIFGAYRPGCAISVIPANGVLLSQEAAAGCTCSYPIRCSMALIRKPNRAQPWTVFVTPGELKPVKHFAVNFGAPADRKDDEGTVWFAYPNPKTRSYTHFPNYGVKFDLNERMLPDMEYYSRDFKSFDVAGTDKPWLFTSGCRGMLRCEIPLTDDNSDQPGVYTVRLGFRAMPGDRPGRRVFDIKLQDEVVAKDFDIVDVARKANCAIVKEYKGIKAQETLVLEFVPNTSEPKVDEMPIINFVEVIRETVGTMVQSSLPLTGEM